MGIKVDHWFVQDASRLLGLTLLEDTAPTGDKASTVYIGKLDTVQLSNAWIAIFPRVDIKMSTGRIYYDIGRGVISSPACDANAAAVSKATRLIEIWWSDAVDTGTIRVWENGEITQVSDTEFNAMLQNLMGYSDIHDLVNDFASQLQARRQKARPTGET